VSRDRIDQVLFVITVFRWAHLDWGIWVAMDDMMVAHRTGLD